MSSRKPFLRAKAYGVHVLTASGIIPAALAMHEITQSRCDPRIVFLYLLAATLIDAIDGPLARRYHVKSNASAIDGRTIDDLLDYLTFAFIPLMLIWRMGWMPEGAGWTVVLAMGASLFGFAHCQAKDESAGFFRGFPSYWNIFAFYAGIASTQVSPWLTAISLWILTLLTVSPVRVLYPNLTPPPWKAWILGGAVVWSLCMILMLYFYPAPDPAITWISLVYPAFYSIASLYLARRQQGGAPAEP